MKVSVKAFQEDYATVDEVWDLNKLPAWWNELEKLIRKYDFVRLEWIPKTVK